MSSGTPLTEARPNVFATLLLLWAGHFVVDFMLGVWSIYKTIAHLDLGKAGIIAGACALIGEGAQVFSGALSDRGWRKQLITCGILATCASMLLAYTQEYNFLFLLYLLTCLGSGAFHPTAVGTIGLLNKSNNGVLIAGFAACGALGMASSQMIFSQVYFALDGSTAWLAIPALLLLIFIVAHRFTHTHSATVAAEKPKFSIKGYLDFFRNRDLTLLYISQVCNQAVFWGTIFLLPDILVSRGYDAWLCYGGGHMIFILGAAAMMVPGGLLADRYSGKFVIVYASAMAIVGYLLFFAVFPLSTPLLVVGLFLLGAAMGMVNPVTVALGVQLAPANPGMVSAFLMGFVWCISEGLGQTGGGLLASLFSDDAPAKALAAVSVLLWLGIACALRLPTLAPHPLSLDRLT